MKTLPLSEVKMKISSIVDTVYSLDEEVMITKNGFPAAVLISPDEYESLKETAAITSDADFMNEINKNRAILKKRKGELYTIEELFS